MTLLALGACMAVVFLIYLPGLEGQFVFDDYSNIKNHSAIQIEDLSFESLYGAALSGESGPLKRPLSMLSFALNYYANGLSPYFFKLTNLIIHLLNGLVIYFLTILILKGYRATSPRDLSSARIYLVSLIVAALWLAHPLNLTPVLYVVQRMTSLSAGFTLLALILFVMARLWMIDDKRGATPLLALSILSMVLASLAKENGLLFPLLAFVTDATIFRFRLGPKRKGCRLLVGFFALTLTIPAAAALGYIGMHPDWITNGYTNRDFSLAERLLTEARVLWFYVSLLLLPTNSRLGLYHDDFLVSHNLFEPITTLLSIVGIVIAITVAFRSIKRMPMVSFAILFFLAGHLMESSVFGLELVHEHRNYLPDYGPALLAGWIVTTPLASRRSQIALHGFTVLFGIALLAVTAIRAQYWSNPLEHSMQEALNHPDSPRAVATLGAVYGELATLSEDNEERYYPLACRTLLHAAELRDNFTIPYFKLIGITNEIGRLTNPLWINELTERLLHRPIAAGTVSIANWLIDSQREKNYLVDPVVMDQIIKSVLANPTLGGRNRAEFLTAASKYFWRNRGDYESALYLIAKAADSQPSRPKYRLHLVALLITIGRYADAEEELRRVADLDHLGILHQDIRKYQALIHDKIQTGRARSNGVSG